MYHFLQTIIPILPELPYHRGFEELPQRDVLVFAFALGGHADAPFMVKNVREAVLFHQADRVEVARNGFPEVAFAFQIGFFNSA